jgi:TatD DNase family protein
MLVDITLVDTHCHLDFERFDADRDEVVARALAAGVGRIIVPAIDPANCPAVLALAERYEPVYAAVGVHPTSSAGWQADWIDRLREFAAHPRVVAIGEIGLDYYWDKSPPAVQRQAFSAQLALAAELGLPVIIHNREAGDDVARLLAESSLNGRDRPGVLHSFSAGWPVAETVLAMGFYLGFTGPVTFPKADELREVAGRTPPDRLLVETDAPFLAPQAHRGRRNEPAYVVETAARLAELHHLPPAEMARQTTANAVRLFGERLLSKGPL